MTHFDEFGSVFAKPQNLVEYESRLVEQMTQASREAVRRLEPATMEVRTGSSDVGVNRRLAGPDGSIRIAPNRDGFYNRDLFLLEIVQIATASRCLAFSYACHPVLDVGWAHTLLSADFPGRTRSTLKDHFGHNTHTQFFQACCGNVRPRALADFQANRFRRPQDGDASAVGVALARDIEQTLEGASRQISLTLRAVEGWFLAPKQTNTGWNRDTMDAYYEKGNAFGAAASYWLANGWDGSAFAPVVPWPIGMFALATDCHFAWFAGEPFAEWQPFLRRHLNDESLVVWGYCGKNAGYLPTEDALLEGGYETQTEIFHKYSPEPLGAGLNTAVANAFQSLRQRLLTA